EYAITKSATAISPLPAGASSSTPWVLKTDLLLEPRTRTIPTTITTIQKTIMTQSILTLLSKEVVGIHVLLTRSLFGADIRRGWLRPVSPAKPTSAPLRFKWLRRTKPQFESRRRR